MKAKNPSMPSSPSRFPVEIPPTAVQLIRDPVTQTAEQCVAALKTEQAALGRRPVWKNSFTAV
ncbi:MAG: hypothetical protein V3V57_08105 [Spirochaetia bacterium]